MATVLTHLAVYLAVFLLILDIKGNLSDINTNSVDPGPDEEGGLRRFDNTITTFMRERGIPGASIAVSKHGQPLFRKGYGRAGVFSLVTPWSLFRIGSVSKPITAMGVLKLLELNQVKLNSKIFGPTGILKQYKLSSGSDLRLLRITVQHLLQHTAGWDMRLTGDPLVYNDIGKKLGSKDPPDKYTIIKYMINQPLQFNPGTRYAYSNFGYLVLGRVVEKVSGQKYENYIQKEFWKSGIYSMKLGHTRKDDRDFSEVEYFTSSPLSRVKSVFPEDGLVTPPYGSFVLENLEASGGWISSASDLVQFLDALNGSLDDSSFCGLNLLRHDTFEMMIAQPEHATGSPWYGMGIVVKDEGRTFWHSGLFDGSTSVVTHDESGFTWAVLLNYRLERNDLDDLMKYATRQMSLWTEEISLPSPPVEDSFISADSNNLVKILIPEGKYPHVFKQISHRGFRLTWFDAVHTDDGIFFNTIWTRNEGRKWKAYHGISSSAYRRRHKSCVAQGYRLLHIATYVSNKKLRYAAIFVKEPWPAWVAYHGYTPHRHRKEFYSLHKEGFRLAVQSVTEYKGKVYIAAIYDKLNLGAYRVRIGLSSSHFTSEFERQVRAGRILSYVQAYMRRGMVRFSAIWTATTTHAWAARHDMSKYTLLNAVLEYGEINIPLSCVTAYMPIGSNIVNFAALWR